jgi:hypothetical protein
VRESFSLKKRHKVSYCSRLHRKHGKCDRSGWTSGQSDDMRACRKEHFASGYIVQLIHSQRYVLERRFLFAEALLMPGWEPIR